METEINIEKDLVLLIDDENICHVFLDLILSEYNNIKLISAFNGEEGISITRQLGKKIRIILCDVMMPNMDGYEIRNILKNEEDLKDIPFAFQTGVYELDPSYDIDNKNTFLLPKPYQKDDLVKLFNNLNISLK